MSIISLWLFPALAGDGSMDHGLEELHFFRISGDCPHSWICCSSVWEYYGRLARKWRRRWGKKAKMEKSGGKNMKKKSGKGRKWKEKILHARFLSYQIIQEESLIIAGVKVIVRDWFLFEFHSKFKLICVSWSLSYEAWATNHRFMPEFEVA